MEIKTTKEILDKYYWNEDGNSYDENKKWASLEDIENKINELRIYSLRLNIFGASFDKEMRTKLRIESKEEPSTLVNEYFKFLLREIDKESEE